MTSPDRGGWRGARRKRRAPRSDSGPGRRQIAKRGWKEAKADNVPLLGAGVAFYAFLALFPR